MVKVFTKFKIKDVIYAAKSWLKGKFLTLEIKIILKNKARK
jgi:hypothetical protein